MTVAPVNITLASNKKISLKWKLYTVSNPNRFNILIHLQICWFAPVFAAYPLQAESISASFLPIVSSSLCLSMKMSLAANNSIYTETVRWTSKQRFVTSKGKCCYHHRQLGWASDEWKATKKTRRITAYAHSSRSRICYMLVARNCDNKHRWKQTKYK